MRRRFDLRWRSLNNLKGKTVYPAKNRVGAWLLWVFVLSGFSGLIYQSIWTQYLGLFLGHSSYAQSLVLMLFMGGMAVGAWLVSRKSARIQRPLLVYAIIEVVIGLLGLTFDGAYHLTTGWAYNQLMPMLGGEHAHWARWLIATALVLPQCVLLGATFPLMSAGYMRLQPHSEGRVLAGLYFSNSMGAAIGALASAYVLLPMLGMPGTVFSAGLINVIVAFMIYPMTKFEGLLDRSPTAPVVEARPVGGAPISRSWIILVVACLTGAASFVYEITWVRMLSLALGTTIHSFEIMLASFIFGIALGGLWLKNRADRVASPLALAGWVQIWMGVAALGSMFIYANAFEWVGWMMRVIVHSAEGYALFNAASAGIALLVMFPAAFFAGMTLPLLTLALMRQGHGEKSIGQAYAFNTVGAIIGVLAAVHILLPSIGLKYSLTVAAVVDMALGAVLICGNSAGVKRFGVSPLGAAVAVAGLSVVAAIGLVKFDPLVMSSSVYRSGQTSLGGDTEMQFFKDGKTATVAVFDVPDGQSRLRMIATNGKVDAAMAVSSTQQPTGDELTMVLLAAMPLSMRDHYERVGIIGFGSGMTTHTLLGHKNVGSVDTVEIEPAMVEGARYFGDRVERAFNDPRSHIIIDDAKSYFSSTTRKYDLIISEPSNPWVGGTATLFSREFYEFVPRQLNKDGLFVQWLQLYEITPDLVGSVLSAMTGSFSDVQAYLAHTGDLILVASPHGKVPALGDGVFAQPILAKDLARIGVHSLRDLQDTFVMDKDALQAYLALYSHRVNSDMYPVLKLQAPVARFERASVTDFDAISSSPWALSRHFGGALPRASDVRVPTGALPLSVVRKAKSAREIFLEITGGEGVTSVDMSGVDWLQVQSLKGFAARCNFGSQQVNPALVVLSLAVETVPYLNDEELDELWVSRPWMKCPLPPGTVQDAFNFVASVSQKRNEDVLKYGQALLDGPDGPALQADNVSGHYVFGAMQYASLVVSDPKVSKLLTQHYWPGLGQQAQASSALRLLTTMAAGKGLRRSDDAGSGPEAVSSPSSSAHELESSR
ncbi:spermine synthase [Stenotrophomonas lactitubi]|uniref:spermine/spermidine synthase domain-containing protein n=1 Tax=Stenotrophomonas lactitubi TaxID=2045214 RepID=UPI0032083082